MTLAQIESYRVAAFNMSQHSENKIHDDAVARKFGFDGALVPGVEVYAYMMHLPVRLWGRAFLERGIAECRFLKPVYDGEIATVTAAPDADGLALEVHSRSEPVARGSASLPATPLPPPELAGEPEVPAARPPADEVSLSPGRALAMRPLMITPDYAAQYLADVREQDVLYSGEGLAHPGLILRALNWALTHNVVLGPWIHVGSRVQNFSPLRVGDEMSVRATIRDNYERKGHRFVELDGVVLANGARPVARVLHTAIWRPRQAE